MRIFLDTCKSKNIQFLELNYKIPGSASSDGRIKAGSQKIDWIGCVNDLILAFNDRKNLQLAIDTLNTTFYKYGLTINVTITKTMILNQQYMNSDYPTTISMLNGEQIENVQIF